MVRCILKFLIFVIILMSARLLVADGSAEHVWRIDDFEDGDLRAAPGLSWFALADDLAGGESVARLEIVSGKSGGSRRALRLAGRSSGRKGAFLGVWVSLEGTGRSVDLKGFEGIRLRARGAGRLLVGLRVGMMNYMAAIDAAGKWRVEEIPFSQLAPQGRVPEGARFSPEAVSALGITTPLIAADRGSPASDVAFEIDDVTIYGRTESAIEPVAVGPPGSVSIARFTPQGSIPRDGWVEIATDPAGDASAALLPDATRLEARTIEDDETVWFRMTLRETPHDRWMGLNLALDLDGNPDNGQPWWGANSTFRFDRLVTVWCFKVADGCQGYIGIADADQASAGNFSSGVPLRFAIDRKRRAFVVGVPRSALRLGANPARVVAAVGSALLWGDDVPNQGSALIR